MAERQTANKNEQGNQSYVSSQTSMKEFSLKALLFGLVLSVILGAANAYLGLKAGMTIAATYPAAVIGMALLRLPFFRGTILEENMTRTVGSIGESVAAGAIFTIPAFLVAGVWTDFNGTDKYFQSTAIMMLGGLIGILFVTILRRVMVEDRDLPFPESQAAAEIHKAGRAGGTGAVYLFGAGVLGAAIQVLKQMKLFASSWEKFIPFTRAEVSLQSAGVLKGSGGAVLSTPGVSPAYMGVGYIIGPRLAALNFSGGLLSWGLFVPLLLYFTGPSLESTFPPGAGEATWIEKANAVWFNVVRPIAIGGMLVSACYTLWKMRNNLINGLKRSVNDVRKAASGAAEISRTEKDLNFRWVAGGILLLGCLTFFLYNYFAKDVGAALAATVIMVIAGFFFAAVSGYLVGLIGSSNNPISGLTLSTVVIAAILMVVLGQKGLPGVAAVLAVAGVICVSAAVAGEMLQDLKVGHILGGTPWKMQTGDIIGVLLASAIMYFPLFILHQGDINMGGSGFGGKNLPAPQASLMALVSQGIVGGQMAWPLIIVGMLMAVGFILIQVKSPMLVCVGMYLPLETTSAIFLGGVVRGIVDRLAEKRKLSEGQKSLVENNGTLLASGLIAGEALVGLVFAFLAFREIPVYEFFSSPSFAGSLLVFFLIGLVLVLVPLRQAGSSSSSRV